MQNRENEESSGDENIFGNKVKENQPQIIPKTKRLFGSSSSESSEHFEQQQNN